MCYIEKTVLPRKKCLLPNYSVFLTFVISNNVKLGGFPELAPFRVSYIRGCKTTLLLPERVMFVSPDTRLNVRAKTST